MIGGLILTSVLFAIARRLFVVRTLCDGSLFRPEANILRAKKDSAPDVRAFCGRSQCQLAMSGLYPYTIPFLENV